ncbi:MAG: nitrogen regulation protein NR(I) [Gammaproteobacteria bacterium]
MIDNSVWVIDDDKSIRWVLEKALVKAGLSVTCFDSGKHVLAKLQYSQPATIITDVRMPGLDGMQLLEKIQGRYPDLPVIIITAHTDLDSAVSAYQGGAFDYLPKPFDVDKAVNVVLRAIEYGRERLPDEQEQIDLDTDISELIGESPAMQDVFRAIGRLSGSHITVLITGESGTGKELVAKALHRHSPRKKEAFVALNMAAIPRDLLESELFGHERGAFTGAQSQRVGRFEQANGGTLFLDEIGDMPAEMQTRLLRVLADGEFYRVGGHSAVRVDVRIVAATHQNLESNVKTGVFREDLFHRLNVIRIHLPALRDRVEDVPMLMRHFLTVAAKELNTEIKILTEEVDAFLKTVEWSGNVRQLENLCRWLTVMATGQYIQLDDLPKDLRENNRAEIDQGDDWQEKLNQWAFHQLSAGKQDILASALPEFEKVMIETALAFTGGKKQDASRLLGWGRNTLTRKIRELDILT